MHKLITLPGSHAIFRDTVLLCGLASSGDRQHMIESISSDQGPWPVFYVIKVWNLTIIYFLTALILAFFGKGCGKDWIFLFLSPLGMLLLPGREVPGRRTSQGISSRGFVLVWRS